MQEDRPVEHGSSIKADLDGPCLRPGAFLLDALYQAVSLLRTYSGNAYGAGADQQAAELRRLASDLQALAERRTREIEGPPWEP